MTSRIMNSKIIRESPTINSKRTLNTLTISISITCAAVLTTTAFLLMCTEYSGVTIQYDYLKLTSLILFVLNMLWFIWIWNLKDSLKSSRRSISTSLVFPTIHGHSNMIEYVHAFTIVILIFAVGFFWNNTFTSTIGTVLFIGAAAASLLEIINTYLVANTISRDEYVFDTPTEQPEKYVDYNGTNISDDSI